MKEKFDLSGYTGLSCDAAEDYFEERGGEYAQKARLFQPKSSKPSWRPQRPTPNDLSATMRGVSFEDQQALLTLNWGCTKEVHDQVQANIDAGMPMLKPKLSGYNVSYTSLAQKEDQQYDTPYTGRTHPYAYQLSAKIDVSVDKRVPPDAIEKHYLRIMLNILWHRATPDIRQEISSKVKGLSERNTARMDADDLSILIRTARAGLEAKGENVNHIPVIASGELWKQLGLAAGKEQGLVLADIPGSGHSAGLSRTSGIFVMVTDEAAERVTQLDQPTLTDTATARLA